MDSLIPLFLGSGLLMLKVESVPDNVSSFYWSKMGVVFNVKGVTDLGRFGWQGPDPEWAEAHGFHLLKKTSEEKKQLDLF